LTVTAGVPASMWRLQERAFGGEDVAVRPDHRDHDWWPRGPNPAGVRELVEDARATVRHRPSGLTLYFLLGGAGNGKSFAARELASAMGIDLRPSSTALARRKYQADVTGVEFIILNDATIATGEEYGQDQERALARDIDEWWQRSASKPVVAFCCVNRGIVIDEIRASLGAGGHASELPVAALRWLNSPASTLLPQGLRSAGVPRPDLAHLDHLAQARWVDGAPELSLL
jgi:hypothetical protein